MLKKVNQPVLFQGNKRKESYFEGWYYKQVTADQKASLSFIPAISINKEDAHSFIQYILVEQEDSGSPITHTGYLRYPLNSFLYYNQPFKVQIGESVFSEKGINIDIVDDSFHFKGNIHFGPLHPIKTTVLQPNIMGFFGYIPKMECYHGVISMQHKLDGFMRVNEKKIDFTGGTGYIEKDWGTSFPKHYIWLQSNHFQNPSTSLFFSIAHIPFHFTEFEGFICNFVLNDEEYRFATYNGSQCIVEEVTGTYTNIRLENKHARLNIHAEILDQGKLIAPVKGTMTKAIKEGISGILKVRFKDKETGKIYEDIGENAGVEIVDYE